MREGKHLQREGQRERERKVGEEVGVGVKRGEDQVIFKPLANSLPIHLCLGSVPSTALKTKEALH